MLKTMFFLLIYDIFIHLNGLFLRIFELINFVNIVANIGNNCHFILLIMSVFFISLIAIKFGIGMQSEQSLPAKDDN